MGGETTPAEALGKPVSVARSSYYPLNIHYGGKIFPGSADFCVFTQPRPQAAGQECIPQAVVHNDFAPEGEIENASGILDLLY